MWSLYWTRVRLSPPPLTMKKLDPRKLFDQAVEKYNNKHYVECAEDLYQLYTQYGICDKDLTVFCCYKIFANKLDNDALYKCKAILNEQEGLDEKQKAVMKMISDFEQNKVSTVDIDFKKLKKYSVINAYYDQSSSGIGDFLRGSCYLYELFAGHNIDFSIDFSKHAIGNHIKSKNKRKIKKIFDTERHNKGSMYEYFTNMKNNLSDVLNPKKKGIFSFGKKPIVLFSNYSDFVDLSPEEKMNFSLNRDTRDFIKSNIQFSKKITKKFKKLNIEDYAVCHFRLGDFNIINEHKIKLNDVDQRNINTKQYNLDYDRYLDLVVSAVIRSRKKVILLSDSNNLKTYVMKNMPERYLKHVFIPHLESFHSSSNPGFLGNIVKDSKFKDDKMFYTALDLKISTEAKHIYSHSVYPWGSGFTYWISKIYDIPLTVEDISNE